MMKVPETLLQDIWTLLSQAVDDREHEFRRVVLGTRSGESIRQRTVILREVIEGEGVVIYADARSQKMTEVKAYPEVSLLFYDNLRQIQLRCEGMTSVQDGAEVKTKYAAINNHRDYTTVLPPGTKIDLDDEVSYDSNQVHFASIFVKINVIEYLSLSKKGHLRMIIERVDNSWTTQRLVP